MIGLEEQVAVALKRLSAQCRREQRRRTEQIESLGLSFEQVGR